MVGLIVMVLTLLTGPGPIATRTRSAVTGVARGGRTRAWIAAHRRELRALPIAIGVALFVFAQLSPAALLLIGSLLVAWELALWALLQDDPADDAEPGAIATGADGPMPSAPSTSGR